MSQQQYRDALEPGYRLHWYTIDQVLGQGGFGITYLAHDNNLDQRVAIKEFLPTAFVVRDENNDVRPATEEHAQQYQWALDRFITEARTLAKFDHNNIVRVLAVFEANNAAYIVMRYEEGQNLEEYLLEHGPLSEQQLLDIILPVIDGLGIVHQAGFIHRDIKPDNIFIRDDGSPVLIDFGAAREAMGDDRKTLTTLVSPGYAPIEQYLTINQDQGPWTDIYALGGTLYRATMGKRPVDAITRSNDLLSEKPDPYRSVAESLGEQYTRHFLRAIDAAMQHKRHLRPQDLMAWKAQLLGEAAAPESEETDSESPTVRLDAEAETVSYSNTTEVIGDDDSPPADGGAKQTKSGGSNVSPVHILIGFVLVAAVFITWFAMKTPESQPAVSAAAQPEPETTAAVKQQAIIVLPFVDLSGDSDQGFFVDGISEDIIIDLSRLSGLKVLARNTSFQYKGQTPDPRQIGQDLGVAYMLEGSVRKSGSQIRVTAQLVDTKTAHQVWADRYDRKLTDIFAVQDDVTQNIVTALALHLTDQDKAALAQKGAQNIEAYELFLRGQGLYRQRTRKSNKQAEEIFKEAIKLDPSYARAYGTLALTLTQRSISGWADNAQESLDRALELARTAVSLDGQSPQAYWSLSFVHMFRGEHHESVDAVQRSIALSPSYADAYGMLAFVKNYMGEAEESIELIHKAMELNPNYSWDYLWNLGFAYYTLGDFEKANEYLEQAQNRNPNIRNLFLFRAVTFVELGMQDDAEWEIEQLLQIYPDLTVTFLSSRTPLADQKALEKYLNNLREAGLPE